MQFDRLPWTLASIRKYPRKITGAPGIWPLALYVLFIIPSACSAQISLSATDFYADQVGRALLAERTPAEAIRRVHAAWFQLNADSGARFPIFPAQSFRGGVATPYGIYLDLAIAADPDEEVTQFFIAHEWGHMMAGDPLNQQKLTAIGTYQAPTGSTKIEDRADRYATAFMLRHRYNIRPVLDFFCTLPVIEDQPDPHSAGPERAKKIARQYNSPDKDDPCGSDATDLEPAIRKMALASAGQFRTVKGKSDGSRFFLSTILIMSKTCSFSIDPDDGATCAYVISPSDPSRIDEEFDMITAAADKAVPTWKDHERTTDTAKWPTLPRREHLWADGRDNGSNFQLKLRNDARTGEFLVLSFSAPIVASAQNGR